MKTNVVIVSLAMIAATMAVAGTSQASPEPEPEGQCNNYGNQVFFSVYGDNTYTCYAQYCVQGDNVPVTTGFSAGWTASSSDATAQASAGSECNNGSEGNSTNSTSTDFRSFLLEVY